ncbi:hypothetical protein C7M84_010508 [Penaeus vannamei]|uniref:Uncharacterized protein n=1 Tax=Penaeus vannamei TaxID=6689 RepID=A0A3R7QLE4_PENVA|nr:hypothetical protein C7M84_010508 [Penaeus vannamei]
MRLTLTRQRHPTHSPSHSDGPPTNPSGISEPDARGALNSARRSLYLVLIPDSCSDLESTKRGAGVSCLSANASHRCILHSCGGRHQALGSPPPVNKGKGHSKARSEPESRSRNRSDELPCHRTPRACEAPLLQFTSCTGSPAIVLGDGQRHDARRVLNPTLTMAAPSGSRLIGHTNVPIRCNSRPAPANHTQFSLPGRPSRTRPRRGPLHGGSTSKERIALRCKKIGACLATAAAAISMPRTSRPNSWASLGVSINLGRMALRGGGFPERIAWLRVEEGMFHHTLKLPSSCPRTPWPRPHHSHLHPRPPARRPSDPRSSHPSVEPSLVIFLPLRRPSFRGDFSRLLSLLSLSPRLLNTGMDGILLFFIPFFRFLTLRETLHRVVIPPPPRSPDAHGRRGNRHAGNSSSCCGIYKPSYKKPP